MPRSPMGGWSFSRWKGDRATNWSVALGRQATDPRNNYFETERLTIRTAPLQPITLGGERGGETPVEIIVVLRALRVFAATVPH
ncbi:MAG: hypothetical protein M3Y58_18575 [Chloroflexota bacterium]|nr:hypothetical protein [Chloroflexota bacterium]